MTEATALPQVKPQNPLEKMSLPALEMLRERVDVEIASRRHLRRLQESEAERLEFETRERPEALAPRPRQIRHAKTGSGYRHPDDASIIWPGVGRRPGWLHAALENGHQLEDLAIQVPVEV